MVLRRRVDGRERGFTLLEVMMATALLSLVVTGVLGLLTHAMDNNVQGQRLSELQLANIAHAELDLGAQAGENRVANRTPR